MNESHSGLERRAAERNISFGALKYVLGACVASTKEVHLMPTLDDILEWGNTNLVFLAKHHFV